ncbi:UNVERIFIED_CONTAM: ribosomal protein S18 acetylase RimI-like enzyme [Paenibacillus sp. PvR008]
MSNNVMIPVLTIRSVELGDCEAVTGLLREVGYPMTCGVMKEVMGTTQEDCQANMMVAEMDGRVVGVIGMHTAQSLAYPDPAVQITMLVVSKEYRGEGIGKRLVACGEEWGRAQGSLHLFITGANNRIKQIEAHAFYNRIGFEKKGYRFSKKLK